MIYSLKKGFIDITTFLENADIFIQVDKLQGQPI